jgi:3-hydroxyacyl-[acyl-carrier-protein] dehydratase
MTDIKEHTFIDINEIIKNIPHRYPFLLIDRVKNLVKNESATGIKNVTINESFFAGHFPTNPVMPGVLIIESMAQTAGVLVCKSAIGNPEDKLVYFTSIEDVKFRKTVVPGDQLVLEVKIDRNKFDFWKFTGVATVDGQVVAKAKFAAKIIDKKDV